MRSATERLVCHIRSDRLGSSVIPKHRHPSHGLVFAFSKLVAGDDYRFQRKSFVCKSLSEAIALKEAKAYVREKIGLYTAKTQGFMVDINTSQDGDSPDTTGFGVFGTMEEADKAGKAEVAAQYEEFVHGTFIHQRYDDHELVEMHYEVHNPNDLDEALKDVEKPEQRRILDEFACELFLPAYEELSIDHTVTEVEIRD